MLVLAIDKNSLNSGKENHLKIYYDTRREIFLYFDWYYKTDISH